MKLLTAEIIKNLKKHPLGSTDGTPVKSVIVKFFTPDSSWTWYAVEGEETSGTDEHGNPWIDWNFFGLVDGLEKEWGYFTLSELAEAIGPMGLHIERDMYFCGQVSTETNETV